MLPREECIFPGCNDGPFPPRTTDVPAISDPGFSVEAARGMAGRTTRTRSEEAPEITGTNGMLPRKECIMPGCNDGDMWRKTRTAEEVPAMTDPSVSVEANKAMEGEPTRTGEEEVAGPTTTGSAIRVLGPCGPHGCFTDKVTFLTGTRRPVETGRVGVEVPAVMAGRPTKTKEEVVGPTTTDSGIHLRPRPCYLFGCRTGKVTFLTGTRRPVETGGVDVEAAGVLEG
ncbi:hypothetical protein BDZ85DRAFT_254866 [Elsinoe ampelina]|uniref:Uncharacterized protein n=1 Tax=Elsinoe ampelina TaxID=302913 RepID=A0A6A6GPW4_9PEZI|nr:hypothetical protein BDZ85DRAFT_254866 [Elsinoe ampelina]